MYRSTSFTLKFQPLEKIGMDIGTTIHESKHYGCSKQIENRFF